MAARMRATSNRKPGVAAAAAAALSAATSTGSSCSSRRTQGGLGLGGGQGRRFGPSPPPSRSRRSSSSRGRSSSRSGRGGRGSGPAGRRGLRSTLHQPAEAAGGPRLIPVESRRRPASSHDGRRGASESRSLQPGPGAEGGGFGPERSPPQRPCVARRPLRLRGGPPSSPRPPCPLHPPRLRARCSLSAPPCILPRRREVQRPRPPSARGPPARPPAKVCGLPSTRRRGRAAARSWQTCSATDLRRWTMGEWGGGADVG